MENQWIHENFDKFRKTKKIFNFLYEWCTHVNKTNEKNRTSLQTKLQKKFITSVLSMWSTKATEKKKLFLNLHNHLAN